MRKRLDFHLWDVTCVTDDGSALIWDIIAAHLPVPSPACFSLFLFFFFPWWLSAKKRETDRNLSYYIAEEADTWNEQKNSTFHWFIYWRWSLKVSIVTAGHSRTYFSLRPVSLHRFISAVSLWRLLFLFIAKWLEALEVSLSGFVYWRGKARELELSFSKTLRSYGYGILSMAVDCGEFEVETLRGFLQNWIKTSSPPCLYRRSGCKESWQAGRRSGLSKPSARAKL